MRHIRRILIAIVGGTILVLGIAMIVLPVPSMIVILAGLGILALEFAWAKHLFSSLRRRLPGGKETTVPMVVDKDAPNSPRP